MSEKWLPLLVAVSAKKGATKDQIAHNDTLKLLDYIGYTDRQLSSHGRSHWFKSSTAYQ